MEVFTAGTLATLVVKVTSVLKYLTAGQWRDALTQAVPWVAGAAIVWLGAQASATEAVRIWGEVSLGELDGWSVILAGVALASTGSFAYDVKKAIDDTDSASEPHLQVPKKATAGTEGASVAPIHSPADPV